ncbi:copper homeostasis protein CutC [Agrobacterium rosae]|uniref:PF03932 family protein CutC n=1 Tax=Agrobacterium rosae TaxID=1972867 RepID=A0AAE5RYF9_9HYPH|nr:copper homeostasis protein CutC [Agrobacterium rosae]KAA3511441.1 copper homeostasis protein CutC [Agrobacterium rosae]KAA3519135.1 copper homeostasis protein CutC [Agrobacterium rosae]MDX8332242.1 copper homeostasis protein CutC [Agrobacterium rosae]MQB49114.1 copper homeostasis protein CutC [Agrobacterium rosae]POO51959.1 copper homeostasis protein CutC [Agrobacterium rosae]
MADILLEVCVDDVQGLHAAIEGGADRIELCSALAVGGLTPSAGLMSVAGQSPIPCYAMIRPRIGDFVYTADELAVLENDISFAASCGLRGVVFGANLPDGRLDRDALTRLSNAMGSMPRTLHRAFDLVPDMAEAIEIAIACGFERILTSGRAVSALDGLTDLKSAIESASGRISIMPGSGVTLETIGALLAELDLTEVHSSCSSSVDVDNPVVTAFGFSAPRVKQTNVEIVRSLKARLKTSQ